jgi:undecaprenyl diphosphate synthase
MANIWYQELSEKERHFHNELLNIGQIPKHVAVIMDGNGRWATGKSYNRLKGHQEGIESVRDIVKAASNIEVKFLTLYAFSIENWSRPQAEVNGLMKLLERYLKKEVAELDANNVRIQTIGKTNALPKEVQKLLYSAIEKTKDNDGLTLILALSYGGRWDLTRALQMIAIDVRRGKLSPEDITEELISNRLQTKDYPEPDLMIRTSGESRISNFLLWEMAYTELFIVDKHWPEFRRYDFYEALLNFAKRERRFGMTSSQIQNIDKSEQESSYLQKVINVFK